VVNRNRTDIHSKEKIVNCGVDRLATLDNFVVACCMLIVVHVQHVLLTGRRRSAMCSLHCYYFIYKDYYLLMYCCRLRIWRFPRAVQHRPRGVRLLRVHTTIRRGRVQSARTEQGMLLHMPPIPPRKGLGQS